MYSMVSLTYLEFLDHDIFFLLINVVATCAVFFFFFSLEFSFNHSLHL